MENNKNLKELTKEISGLLLDCMTLLEIFEEISNAEPKECFCINSLQRDLKLAFDYIEQSRHLISKPD